MSSRIKPPVLMELRRRFEARSWKIDPRWDFEKVLLACAASNGIERERAVATLEKAEASGWLVIVRHRATGLAEGIRLRREAHEHLYLALGEELPARLSEQAAAIFAQQPMFEGAPAWLQQRWREWCADSSKSPPNPRFAGMNTAEIQHCLRDLRALLSRAEHPLLEPVREVSTRLTGSSKRLQESKAVLLHCLAEITEGRLVTFQDFGISEGASSVTLWGSWGLELPGGSVDLAAFAEPVRISITDISAASISVPHLPVVTVENRTSLVSWALRKPRALLISSGELGGFSNNAVISLLKRLPKTTDIYHWGDSDPAGFAILASMRQRTGRRITGLGMNYRPASAPVPLSLNDTREIARLLESPFLVEEELEELEAMRRSGDKGAFEQEGQTKPPALFPEA
jgi:hypothetical protein